MIFRQNFVCGLILGGALAVTGACGDDDGGVDAAPADAAPVDAESADAVPPDAGYDPVTIRFAARVGDEEASCSAAAYPNLGTGASAATINDLRFYVSNVRLLSGDQEVPVILEQDETWQYEDVALLDFEDGTGGCATNGNSDLNTTVRASVPPGSYDGVAFTLGVPYTLNHQELTELPSPLNVAAMYWAWAIGHKFMRVDLALDGGGAWNVHLGSAMCDSLDPPNEPPVAGCARPNRAQIALADFDAATDTIVLDVATLVEDSDLGANAGAAPGCQSFPDDGDDCTPLYPKLGMSFDTGRCEDDCVGQSAFRVE